jgi:hypothetical protein
MVRLKRQGWQPEKDHVLAVHELGRTGKERAADVTAQLTSRTDTSHRSYVRKFTAGVNGGGQRERLGAAGSTTGERHGYFYFSYCIQAVNVEQRRSKLLLLSTSIIYLRR